jgi:hypothetical protein
VVDLSRHSLPGEPPPPERRELLTTSRRHGSDPLSRVAGGVRPALHFRRPPERHAALGAGPHHASIPIRRPTSSDSQNLRQPFSGLPCMK